MRQTNIVENGYLAILFNMGNNGHGINLYGIIMILMGNLHAGGQYNLGHLSLLHRYLSGSLVIATRQYNGQQFQPHSVETVLWFKSSAI